MTKESLITIAYWDRSSNIMGCDMTSLIHLPKRYEISLAARKYNSKH